MKNEKTIKAGGKNVKVATERHTEHVHKFVVTATVGETTVTRRITVGPSDGSGKADYSQAQFAADMDKARTRAAEHAAFKEKVKNFTLD